jgi:hypothetical protein
METGLKEEDLPGGSRGRIPGGRRSGASMARKINRLPSSRGTPRALPSSRAPPRALPSSLAPLFLVGIGDWGSGDWGFGDRAFRAFTKITLAFFTLVVAFRAFRPGADFLGADQERECGNFRGKGREFWGEGREILVG